MSTTLFPAYSALIFGLALAVILVVPVAAIRYRVKGGLTVGLVVMYFVVLVYLVALGTYTLLPLPSRIPDFCDVHDVQSQLVPGQFLADIVREAESRGGGFAALLRNPATVQFVFNVALFVPLGMVVRYFTRCPRLVVVLVAFGASLLIETTQITGVWGLYPCAYRLFDVDDLIANTAGGAIGAFAAPLMRIFPGQVAMRPGDPRPITAARRLLGMFCDLVVTTLGALIVFFVYIAIVPDRSSLPESVDAFFRLVFGALVLAVVQLVWVVVTGRTIGETVVRLEPVSPTRVLSRVLRWAIGTGGYTVLSVIQAPVIATALIVGVIVSVVAVFVTRDRRGLAYVITRWGLRDDRSEVAPFDEGAVVDRGSRR